MGILYKVALSCKLSAASPFNTTQHLSNCFPNISIISELSKLIMLLLPGLANTNVTVSMVTAVRNDRNKKRKPRQDGCVTSQQTDAELTPEEETLIAQVVKAHDETFNKRHDQEKFKVK